MPKPGERHAKWPQVTEIRRPATLRVFRYKAGECTLQTIIGDQSMPMAREELVKRARAAMAQRTFIVQSVPGSEADELCFVPYEDRCEILSIHSNGWRRHHGDHRRSLIQILSDLAAAVACGHLRLLSDEELAEELDHGELLLTRRVTDSATLAEARVHIGEALSGLGFPADRRDQTVLCASEAATNALVHGGGAGTITLRSIEGGARVVVADQGRGLNFLNWLESPAIGAQASMGYGYRIILDHIDHVCLHTAASGTTLILDQAV